MCQRALGAGGEQVITSSGLEDSRFARAGDPYARHLGRRYGACGACRLSWWRRDRVNVYRAMRREKKPTARRYEYIVHGHWDWGANAPRRRGWQQGATEPRSVGAPGDGAEIEPVRLKLSGMSGKDGSSVGKGNAMYIAEHRSVARITTPRIARRHTQMASGGGEHGVGVVMNASDNLIN